jgi:hypothetical protein
VKFVVLELKKFKSMSNLEKKNCLKGGKKKIIKADKKKMKKKK